MTLALLATDQQSISVSLVTPLIYSTLEITRLAVHVHPLSTLAPVFALIATHSAHLAQPAAIVSLLLNVSASTTLTP